MNEDQAAVAAVQSEWADAFQKRDVERIVALYAPQTAFWGSTNDLHENPDGVRRYFTDLPPSFKRSRWDKPHVIRLGKDVLAASGNVVFIKEVDGKDVELPYRMTHILVRRGDGWKIATHHASPQFA